MFSIRKYVFLYFMKIGQLCNKALLVNVQTYIMLFMNRKLNYFKCYQHIIFVANCRRSIDIVVVLIIMTHKMLMKSQSTPPPVIPISCVIILMCNAMHTGANCLAVGVGLLAIKCLHFTSHFTPFPFQRLLSTRSWSPQKQ